MDFDALPRYPAAGPEGPDRDAGRPCDRWEAAAAALAVAVAGTVVGSAGALVLLWWLMTAPPVNALLGFNLPGLGVLLAAAGGVAGVLLRALVRLSHADAADDYDDAWPAAVIGGPPANRRNSR